MPKLVVLRTVVYVSAEGGDHMRLTGAMVRVAIVAPLAALTLLASSEPLQAQTADYPIGQCTLTPAQEGDAIRRENQALQASHPQPSDAAGEHAIFQWTYAYTTETLRRAELHRVCLGSYYQDYYDRLVLAQTSAKSGCERTASANGPCPATFPMVASQVVPQESAGAQAPSALDGEWRGERSGNVVRNTSRSGGFDAVAVTNNPDQSAPLFFSQTAPGEYRYTFPDGTQAVVQMLGPDHFRSPTQTDGPTCSAWCAGKDLPSSRLRRA